MRPPSLALALLLSLALSFAAGGSRATAGKVESSDPGASHASARTTYRNEGLPGIVRLLRRVETGVRVLHVGAHPDDEDSAMLAALSLGRGARVTYLSLTRGEGGQNRIGSETAEELGVLRTGELLAARERDGADQLFGRAIDFGFTKSADEAFQKWGRENLVEDVVRAIRRVRPHVVICRFQGTEKDGHGQHQVSAVAAREAFRAAADPGRFPELAAAGLGPWRASKLYVGHFEDGPDVTLRVDASGVDPFEGRSFAAIGYAGRSLHRSQDMGMAESEAPLRGSFLQLVETADGAGASDGSKPAPETDLFDGIERDAPALSPTIAEVLATPGAMADPSLLAPGIAAMLKAARASNADTETIRDLERALAMALGVRCEAIAKGPRVLGGAPVEVALAMHAPRAERLGDPAWRLEGGERLADANATGRLSASGADAAPGTPYYLAAPREGWLYRWSEDSENAPGDESKSETPANGAVARGLGRPFLGAPVATFSFEYEGVPVSLPVAVELRTVDPGFGEIREDVPTLPAVALDFDPPVVLARKSAALDENGDGVTVHAESRDLGGAGFKGRLHVRWNFVGVSKPSSVASFESDEPAVSVAPATSPAPASASAPATKSARIVDSLIPLELAPGESRELAIRVPESVMRDAPARIAFEAQWIADAPASSITPASSGSSNSASRAPSILPAYSVKRIAHRHIRPVTVCRPAAGEVRLVDVAVPEHLYVGYVEGAGDRVAETLEAMGARVERLDEKVLARADLSVFDAIVLGVRAYEVRPDLAARNGRLLDYARGGGTLVVQYNKFAAVGGASPAPFPMTLASPADRVTDETAPVRVLSPDHPLMTWPNAIGAADFDGWVQERGLYFWSSWDDAYQPLLESADPGDEPKRGGLLVAPLGRGTYVYAGYAFFRQLPEGVEGATRLFVNLVSAGMRTD